MKNLNLIKRLWTDSHEKQSPQRFARYAAMLIMLLTLGVGQMWGASTVNGGEVYFDASQSGWSVSDVQFVIGHNSYSNFYNMSAISNTQLYYISAASWSDATYFAFANGCSSWGSEGNKYSDRTQWISGKYSAAKTSYTLNSGSTYLFYTSSSSNNASINTSSPAGYLGAGKTYADLNYTQTLNQTLSTNGGSSYSTSTLSLATVTVSSYKLNGKSSSTADAGTIETDASSTSCKAARSATVTYSVSDVTTGYDFVGWYDGSTQKSTATTYNTYRATSNKTITARFKKKQYTVSYGVNSSTRYGSISLNSGSAVTTTSSSTLNHGTSISFTATPNSGYQVEGWYSDASCTVGNRLQEGGTSYNAGTLTAAKTVYVKFKVRTGGTITLSAGSNGQVSADNSTWGTTKTITDVTTATDVNIYARGNTGYQFSSWTKSSGSGTIKTNAASGVFTTVAYEDATVTASFNETKSTITVTTATSSQGTLKFGSTSKSWGTTASVGVATEQSITATAAAGFAFVRWDLTGAAATSSSTTSATITLKADGSGSTGTATAVFEEDLSSPWVLKGGTNITGDNWSTEHAMTKKTGHSTENVAYYTANISSTNSGTSGTADAWSFKLIKNSTWYDLTADGSYWWKRSTSANQSLTTSGANIQICADVAGTYEIKVDYSTATPKITVTFPTKYTVTYSVSPSGAASAITTSPSVTSGGSVAAGTSMTFTHAAAKTGYSWYRWENGSGSSLGTGSTYTTTINANTTVVAKYTENTFNVTATASTGGSATPASATSMGQVTGGDITASPNTGYNFTNWTITSGSGYFGASGSASTSTTANTKFRPTAAATIQANFTPKTTTITLNNQDATTPGSTSVTATYDAAMPAITLPTKTGYTFGGYWGSSGGSGPQYYNADGSSTQNWNNENSTYTLFAKWTAKTTTITLDQTGAASAGSVTTRTGTYDADMPAITGSGSLPTAPQGYAFMGYYDALEPLGTQYYNSNGTSAHTWDKEDAAVTLHAYFKKAEITTLALSAGTVLPGGSVTATPTVEPTPTGTHKICWKLLYNNGTEYSPQPIFTSGEGNAVSFTAPNASGTYKVRAQLRTGSESECGAGTLLSEQVASFVVAGTHTVTIQYKCGDVTVKSSTVVEGVKPLEWSEEITPDEIFGYSFEKWVAGDGVTMTINGGVTTIETGGETTGKATTHAVQIKAIYDGKLIAKYTKKNIIYFKNTLGWTNVYYHDSYWANSQGGAGNKGQSHINQAMSLVPGTTNIYYWEGTPTSANVAFTDHTYDNYQAFWSKTFDAKVVYPSNPTCASSGDSNYGYNAGTPMFVLVEQDGQDFNKNDGGKAIYYNKGYWRAYDPTTGESGSTGYTLKIYNQTADDGSRELLQSIPFTNADASGQIFKASINLEAAKGYGIKVERDNSLMYTNSEGHLHRTGDVVALSVNPDNYAAIWIKSTAAGDYDFIITCNGSGQLCLQATFPAAKNDYRVLYTDNATWSNGAHTPESWVHPSRVISAEAGATDTISFFVSKDNLPEYKIQKVSSINEETGAITWTDVSPSWTSISVDETGVYNFIFNQPSAGSISLSKTEAYTGSYYIRTDNAGSTKWENYRTEDHKMTYSEYAAKITHTGEEWKDFTHYFMKYVDKDKESGKYKNVKFTVANDYSPCISDTLVRQAGDVTPNNVDAYGNLQASANIRFMWNIKNNKLQRAYLAAAQSDGTKFLVLQGQSGKLLAPDGTALLDANGNNHRGGTDAIQFTDKEHWMYEAEVKAVPGGRVKLYATYNSSTFYYYGDNTASFTGTSAIDLVTGNGGEAQTIRVVYDFKTDRLIAAWVPSEETIENEKTVNADIMLIREHQGQGHQINLKGSGSIKTNKTVYGVLRFNRWTLNNKSTAAGHAVLPVGEQKSQYERFNYMISFPFDVKVGEIFGFGTIGRHYRIYYYDGLGRAQEGFFAERGDDNWRMIDDTDSILHANQGYLLQLNYIRMADDNTETWPQANLNEVELYFPAMNTINTISLADVTIPALGDAYNCKINLQPTYHALNNPDSVEADRRVKDSYWRCIGVPGFTSYAANDTWENFNWNADTENMPYLYEWHMDDNKLSVVSSSTFTFKPMHAYLIQNGNSFTWSSVAVPSKTSIVARRQAPASEDGYYEFYLEMSKDEEPQDHTYVRLTDNENVTADFDFGQDLSKELNSGANIFTKVGYERLAANNLPLSEQTTIVPVGVKIAAEGNYTFAMPEGTHGIGVTLVDNETGDRTNLSLFDYSVNLTKGDYANRFILEISPVKQMPTDIENVQGDNVQGAKARKVMVDGILYIVKDGKVFDARGAKVK